MQVLRFVPLALGALPVMVAVACYGPTSMRVELVTDFTCGERPSAAVYSGGDDANPRGVSTDCTVATTDVGAWSLGDLLFAPEKDRGATVTMKVRMAVNGADPAKVCDPKLPTASGCVFASRKFTYIEHEQARFAVRLYRDCLGKVCGDGQTCIQGGQCVSDEVTCAGDACGVAGEKPLVASSPVDGGADAAPDAALDARVVPTCRPADGGTDFATADQLPPHMAASTTRVYWDDAQTVYALDMATGTKSTVLAATPDKVSLIAAGPGAVWWSREVAANPYAYSIYANGAQMPNSGIGSGGQPVFMTAVAADTGGVAEEAAYFQVESGLVRSSPSNGAFVVNIALGTVKLSALSHDAKSLLAVEAVGAPATLVPIAYAGGQVGTAIDSDVGALGTNGHNAYYAKTAGGIYLVDQTKTTPSLLASSMANVPELAVDATHVYWVDQDGGHRPLVVRAPLSVTANATPQLVVSAANGQTTLRGLAPDASPNGCLYYWTNTSTGNVALRAVPKP